MVLRWGRLSDRIGRKPVILFGIFGMAMSSALFGLSTTYVGLIISRALAGGLSGNIGVMKSAIGEITDSTNIAEGKKSDLLLPDCRLIVFLLKDSHFYPWYGQLALPW